MQALQALMVLRGQRVPLDQPALQELQVLQVLQARWVLRAPPVRVSIQICRL